MSLADRIKDAIRDRQRWREVARKRELAEQELIATLEAAERSLKRKRRKLRFLRGESRRPDKREQLADEIDELEFQVDQLTDRLVVRERKSENAREALRKRQARVKRLKERQRERKAATNAPSRYLSYADFNCREGGPVPEYMYPHLDDLCERVIDKMRARFGAVYVTSGHRWSWYDAKIGGVGGYHVYEKYRSQPAADLIFATGTPAEWAAYARSLAVGGVGQYNASGFVHVDTGPRRDWWG